MFISPKHVIEQGWIQHPQCKTYQDWVDRKFVSPNAIDWTLDDMYMIGFDNDDTDLYTFYVSENKKETIPLQRMSPYARYDDNVVGWSVNSSYNYDIMSDCYVEIPQGTLALLYIRSTFARVGCTLSNTVFDQGFKGNVGSVLHVGRYGGFIAQGCRIAQIGFIRAEDSGIIYSGGYNTANGQHWTKKQESTDVK